MIASTSFRLPFFHRKGRLINTSEEMKRTIDGQNTIFVTKSEWKMLVSNGSGGAT